MPQNLTISIEVKKPMFSTVALNALARTLSIAARMRLISHDRAVSIFTGTVKRYCRWRIDRGQWRRFD